MNILNFHVWNLRIANLGIKSLVDDNPCIRTLLGIVRVYEHHNGGAGYTIVGVLVMRFDMQEVLQKNLLAQCRVISLSSIYKYVCVARG